jgi:hypothetical protein
MANLQETEPLLDQRADRPVSSYDIEQRPAQPLEETIPKYKIVLGYLLVMASGFLFTGANVVQKTFTGKTNFSNLLLVRSICQITSTGSWIGYSNKSLSGPSEVKTKVIVQTIFGGFLLLAIFIAVKHVPLGNAQAMFSCTPVSLLLILADLLRRFPLTASPPLKIAEIILQVIRNCGILCGRKKWAEFFMIKIGRWCYRGKDVKRKGE